MAACVLCRRGLLLRHLPGLRKGFAEAQHMCVQRVNDEDKRLATLHPSFWQQSNHYTVSCSRNLSSSKNTCLNLAFNKYPEPEMPSVSLDNGKPKLPDVKVDPRAFLKCRPGYTSITLDLTRRPHPIRWEEALELLQKVTVLNSSMETSEVSHFLTELSHLSPDDISTVMADHRFTTLLKYSVEHLQLFTPLELLKVLQSFVWLKMPTGHSVLRLYEAELSRRADQMSLHQLLLAADLWRCIGKQVPRFLKRLYDSVHLNFGQIGLLELVHLLYIMGEGRQCPKYLIHPVEKHLMLHLQQLYPEEVGAVCLGLFKSQTSMSESAVIDLVDKAHSFVEDMSDFAMVNVLKYLRFSFVFHKAWMEAMAQEVPQRAHRMGVQGLMHVALGCSAIHYRNDKILMAVAERIPSLVQYCRTKDSCKLLWAFGTLGFPPSQSPNFYASLTESLRQREAEFQKYPEHLLSGLLGLAFVSLFPEDLISLALSPKFVNLALKSTQCQKKELLTLDETVALELPHWTGPRLSSELTEEVSEILWKFAQSDVCLKPEVLEAESTLQELLGGAKFVSKRMILPHTRSIDLEVHFDSTGQPIPVKVESDTASSSPENGASEPPQDLGRTNVGVTITEDLLAQLTNNKNSTKPSAPPPTIKPPPLRRVQPEKCGSVFSMGVSLSRELTEALVKPSSLAASPHPVDSDKIVKLAIQVAHRNHYCYRSPQLLGFHALKRRHLELLGYRVVVLNHKDWIPMLRRGKTEKLAYLRCKVYNSL